MPPEDYIKLPNGQKIYLRDTYGQVSEHDVEKKSHAFSLFQDFNYDYDNKLNSSEIKSIFDSVRECANLDGNNELSLEELDIFIKKHISDEYTLSLINPREVLKFFTDIQKASDKNLKTDVKVSNTIDEIFPELKIFNLGKDNNVDLSKLSMEEIRKHYTPKKYNIVEIKQLSQIQRTDLPPIPDAPPHEYSLFIITNKETGKEVLRYSENIYGDNTFNMELIDETTNKKIRLGTSVENGTTYIESEHSDSRIIICDSKLAYAANSETLISFENGIITYKFYEDEVVSYTNGRPEKNKKISKTRTSYKEYKTNHTDISSKINELIMSNNAAELVKCIKESVESNDIGLDMDNYYALTNRELVDDIKNSNLPAKIKEKLLNKINGPFVDSKYYDAHATIDNTRIQNDYYVSKNEYSVKYDGPIINIYNKTTGNKTRINLRTLLRGFNLSHHVDQKYALKNLQSYPAEMLENLAIEVEGIFSMKKGEKTNEDDSIKAAGYYVSDKIVDNYRLDPNTISHELGHAIDDDANFEYLSSKSKFIDVYNDCITRYEKKGFKRFDNQNPKAGSTNNNFRGFNYATYKPDEAFAICMQIIMGYEDSKTEFIHDQMPELIDASIEMYTEIMQRPQEERRII